MNLNALRALFRATTPATQAHNDDGFNALSRKMSFKKAYPYSKSLYEKAPKYHFKHYTINTKRHKIKADDEVQKGLDDENSHDKADE